MVCTDKITKLVRLVSYLVGDGELTAPAILRLFFTPVVLFYRVCALFYMIAILGLQTPFGKHCLNY